MEPVAVVGECAAASLLLSDFEYDLPAELIAQTPAVEREQARLLVLDRRSGSRRHTDVGDLPGCLSPGDLLIVNDSRVIPARLFCRTAHDGRVELLLVRPVGESRWLCLGRPSKRLRTGTVLTCAAGVDATIVAAEDDGRFQVAFTGTSDLPAWFEQHAEVPLPPYIRRPDGPLPLDRTRYQTMFATVPGSVAAPTAGLHFTPHLVAQLAARDITLARITLHVGPGTFLPVRCADVRRHRMDPEWYAIPARTADHIAAAKAGGRRVVAVGTTTTRALESAAAETGVVRAGCGWADRFIVPGDELRVVDALFTNFHLPGSTLLLLVCAFAGRGAILAAYADAVRRGYRFYSYGDAMLIR